MSRCATHGPFDDFETGECPGCIADRIARDEAAGDRWWLVSAWNEQDQYCREYAVQADDANDARVAAARHATGRGEVVEGVVRTDAEFAKFAGEVVAC